MIALTDDDGSLDEEQQALDYHDDNVSEMSISIQRLITSLTHTMFEQFP